MWKDDKGVSELVGWLLAFAVLTFSASFIFVASYPYISSTMDDSRSKLSEVQMTMLDLSASKCSLGDVPSQNVKFNLNNGDFKVETGGNNLTIWAVFQRGAKEEKSTVYTGSIGRALYTTGDLVPGSSLGMGSVTENDGVIIGYEGGGVWKKRGNSVTMLASPEFHYKSDTLTLPIIKLNSNYSASGRGVIPLYIQKERASVYYPNTSINNNFTNPLTCSHMEIEIQSDFWKGWKDYLEERTDTEVVNVDRKNNTISANMSVKSEVTTRAYDMPIDVNNLDTYEKNPMDQLDIDFKGLHPDYKLIWYTKTDPALVIYMQKKSGGGPDDFILDVYYGNSTKFEGWRTNGTLEWTEDDTYRLDFLNQSLEMIYKSSSPPKFDSDNWPDSSWTDLSWTWGSDMNNTDSGDFDGGDKNTLDSVIQHYFHVLANQTSSDITLYEGDKTKGFNPDLTTYTLGYHMKPPIITYLHITEHEIAIK
ncbi:MAG: hypothetical protein R6U44_03680 [Archaeoglobaceae archaeon]